MIDHKWSVLSNLNSKFSLGAIICIYTFASTQTSISLRHGSGSFFCVKGQVINVLSFVESLCHSFFIAFVVQKQSWTAPTHKDRQQADWPAGHGLLIQSAQPRRGTHGAGYGFHGPQEHVSLWISSTIIKFCEDWKFSF